MPKVSESVDDPTQLTGSRIDVPVRIGWLLRTSRSTARLSLRQMSAGMGAHGISLSAATLSRVESEGQRSAEALDGYARVLGLPDGALRSVVDVLCRSFPYSPAPQRMPKESSLERFSAACEAVETDPTGGAWLTFARHHSSGRGFGLPSSLMTTHVRRLVDEVSRSLHTARMTRCEALVQLRRSAYADVVAQVCREQILAPGCQLVDLPANILAEQPSPEVVVFLGELLNHPVAHVAQGASYALQGLLVAGGLPLSDWTILVPHLARAVLDVGDRPERSLMLAQLGAALPPPLQELVRSGCDLPRPPASGPTVWSRTRCNRHYEFAMSLAAQACSRLGHREEPVLARLVFEALYDPRGTRKSNASYLLAASAFTGVLSELLLEHQHDGPDEGSRAALLRLSLFCHRAEPLALADDWIDSRDPVEFGFAVGLAARRGTILPEEALQRGLVGDEQLAHRTLFAAGMAADPRLAAIARDETLPEPLRLGARWWAERDGRVRS